MYDLLACAPFIKVSCICSGTLAASHGDPRLKDSSLDRRPAECTTTREPQDTCGTSTSFALHTCCGSI